MSSNKKDNSSNFDFDTEKLKKYGSKFAYYFDIFYRVMKGFVGVIAIILIVVAFLAGGTVIGYFASLVEDTPIPTHAEMEKQVYDYNKKSTLFYADNSKISDLRSDLIRTPVSLDEMSPLIINAVVATEDENFFLHEGIVPKALIRAGLQEVTGAAMVSGGSTLTQQLIKQQILSAEVTHSRKAVEIMYAMHLENSFEKNEILEAYMNISPFGRNNNGRNIAGIEEAAQGIFGVPASEVNLPQAAFLAGLPKSPISYSPYTQYGQVKEDVSAGLYRQGEVLYSMYREGYIDEQAYNEARAYDVTDDFIRQTEEDTRDPALSYVYNLVKEEAQEIIMDAMILEDGITEEQLAQDSDLKTQYKDEADFEMTNGGYNIYSTIDPVIHNAVEQRVSEIKDSFGQPKKLTWVDAEGVRQTSEKDYPVQIGGTLIDNATGRVLSFIGGRDFDVDNHNIAFDSRRGTGSAIKPIVAYGPALASNFITPATIIPDTELVVSDGPGETHSISNVGRTTNDWGDARRWLVASQNIPATKVYLGMFENNINPATYVRRMGIGPDAISDADFANASTALGGYSLGPTPTEVSGAFAAIGNKGVFNEPYVIERIVNSNGDVIYQHELDPVQVWPESANYLLYDMLRGVTSTGGTARSLPGTLDFNVDLASKTGTTNNTQDVWYAGVTPKVSFTTWMGHGRNIELDSANGLSPSQRNLRNWASIMNAVYSVKPEVIGVGETLPLPADGSVTSSTVLASTGMKPGNVSVPNKGTVQIGGPTKSELFRKDNIPGTTVYDFAVGAKPEETRGFWNKSINIQKPPTSSPKPEEDSDESVEDESSESEEETDDSENSDNNEEETPAPPEDSDSEDPQDPPANEENENNEDNGNADND